LRHPLLPFVELAGEIGTLERFAIEKSGALYLGMAALDNSSGTYQGSKAPSNVNKRAKAAMMSRSICTVGQSNNLKATTKRNHRKAKKHNQAIRALERHMVRMIFKLLKENRSYDIR